MARQLLFCVETNKTCNSDWMYINRMIQHFYSDTNEIRRKPIYMDGKMKYRDNAVTHRIKDQTKKFDRIGTTTVIYCIDTDNWDNDQNHLRELQEIEGYCRDHGYEIIWFCRDIEHVFLGKQISDSEKRAMAEQYLRQNRITEMDIGKLQVKEKRVKCSNILLVLDKYLERANEI